MNDRNLEKEEKREKKLSSKQGKEESERNRDREKEISRRVLISLNAIFAILHNLIKAAYNLHCLFQNYKG